MELGDVIQLIKDDDAGMQSAILCGLQGAYTYPDSPGHTWLYHMSSEYSGNVLTVIAGIRAAVTPLLKD